MTFYNGDDIVIFTQMRWILLYCYTMIMNMLDWNI